MSAKVLRSTPLRISLTLGGAFLLAMLLAGIIAWQLTSHELAVRLDAAISEDFTILGNTFDSNDIVDLRDSVMSHVAATADHTRIYMLRATNGAVLAGNITQAPVPLGWSLVSGAELGIPGTERYRVFSTAVGGNPLIVGASLGETDAVGRLVATSLTVAAGLLTLAVAMFGMVLAKRGQRRLWEISDVMRKVGEGELGARISVSRRGDDVDSVAEQVNRALDRLAALVESMRQVSVDIAHDLKTPLNRLSMTIAEARSAAEGTQIEGHLAQAEAEIGRIDATFEALLRVAQIESGSRRARFVLVAIGELLKPLTEIYADVAEEKSQSMTVEIAGTLAPIRGDRELLTQLFVNLIENAIRYSPQNAAIRITAVEATEAVIVEIADDGPGIPEGERTEVFRRLYRLDRSRSSPGTGLGLSLVKAIAELHGATVSLEDNKPGLRAIVRFPLPADAR